MPPAILSPLPEELEPAGAPAGAVRGTGVVAGFPTGGVARG